MFNSAYDMVILAKKRARERVTEIIYNEAFHGNLSVLLEPDYFEYNEDFIKELETKGFTITKIVEGNSIVKIDVSWKYKTEFEKFVIDS